MKTPVIYSEGHRLHDAVTGTWVGVTIATDEVPERVERIVERLASAGHEISRAVAHDDTVLETVHAPAMIEYMRDAHDNWVAAGYPEVPGQTQVTAYAFPLPGVLGDRPMRLPVSPGALAGVYSMDTMTQIGAGTYRGARAAVDMALTAADLIIEGADSAYAACRPPGHHAGRDFFGGSCYLNNAAAAAQRLRDGGFERVGIIDLDAHHGNGTQEIFYTRGDVLYGSVHVDPARGWFPHFAGHASETGSGSGAGKNLNLPIEPGSGDDVWLPSVERLVVGVADFGADVVVVSLGVDAAITDPESPLLITRSGYAGAGERIASLELPTVFVQEGGYDLATIADLVEATISAFDVKREVSRR